MKKILKIGNAQAFWGDRTEAASQLLQQQPDLDYLTFDYLAEVSLSIMAAQKEKNPQAGYARDFIEVIKSLISFWKQGSRVKIIANAGGLDPVACGREVASLLKENHLSLRVFVVTGDDVLDKIKENSSYAGFNHLDTQESIATILPRLTTANAYLGAKPIVEALEKGADIVITGRIADPSLVVAPCVKEFRWSWSDYDRLAQATVAGHLIECGTQVTGGISNQWLKIPHHLNIGYPFIEMQANGEFVVTKPQDSGGAVTLETVKEQLLYEIGDPNHYLSPDVEVSFLSLELKPETNDRVKVVGAIGRPAPNTYKVSATYKNGYKAEGTLALFGANVQKKAQECAKAIFFHVKEKGYDLQHTCTECLGVGDLVPGVLSPEYASSAKECVLRIAAADQRKEAIECFVKEIAPMVTAGPAGTTGYISGRPHIWPVYGFWPCLIPMDQVKAEIQAISI